MCTEFLLEDELVLERMVAVVAQQYGYIVLNAIGLTHLKILTIIHFPSPLSYHVKCYI